MAALAGICGDASFSGERFTIGIKPVSGRDDSNINNYATQTREDDLRADSDDACTGLCGYTRGVKRGVCTGSSPRVFEFSSVSLSGRRICSTSVARATVSGDSAEALASGGDVHHLG